MSPTVVTQYGDHPGSSLAESDGQVEGHSGEPIEGESPSHCRSSLRFTPQEITKDVARVKDAHRDVHNDDSIPPVAHWTLTLVDC